MHQLLKIPLHVFFLLRHLVGLSTLLRSLRFFILGQLLLLSGFLNLPLPLQVYLNHGHLFLSAHFILLVVSHEREASLVVIVKRALVHIAREVEPPEVQSDIVVVDYGHSTGVFRVD